MMRVTLDELVCGIAFAAIVLALPGIIYTAFWLMYSFWHFMGVL
jgi:hypothetical protein